VLAAARMEAAGGMEVVAVVIINLTTP